MAIDFLNFCLVGTTGTRVQVNTAVPNAKKHVAMSLHIGNNDPAPQAVVVERWTGTAWLKLHPSLPLPAYGSFTFPKLVLTPGQYIAVTPSKAGVIDVDLNVMERG